MALFFLVLILAAFGIFDDRTIMNNMTGETVNQGPNRGDAGPSSIHNSESNSGSWRKYLNLSSDKEEKAESEASTARVPGESTHQPTEVMSQAQPGSEGTHRPHLSSTASTPSSSFFRGLSDAAPTPELGEEVQQVSPTHSISQTDLWNEVSSSAPTPGQDNQPPLVVEQPPAAGPSEPRRDLSHVPPRSPPSSSLSDQEVLKQFFLEEGAAVEQQEQPGVPEALPLAPAPAEDPELITTSIITKMKQLYPNDPWNPDNPLIRGERIFAGGKGKKNIRPMTIEELQHIFDRLERDGKKSNWAKELHRRIDTWTWQNPRGPS